MLTPRSSTESRHDVPGRSSPAPAKDGVRTDSRAGLFPVAARRPGRLVTRPPFSGRSPVRDDHRPDTAEHGDPGGLPGYARSRESGVPAVFLGTVRPFARPGCAGHRRTGDRKIQIGPVIFVSNHSSWVDVPVVGGVLPGPFVAKGDVERWPVVRTIARLGRTVFVSRQRGSTGRERDAMQEVLARGDNLILFPEGTSSDGSRVLPFRSSFFALAEDKSPEGGTSAGNRARTVARPPLIQPVSVVYDRLNGLPAGRSSRPVFAWYGDMDIASHFWRMTQHLDMRVTVLLHAPLDPATFPDRKSLSRAVWQTVADGASMLRQNRPARPLSVAPARPDDLADREPAFA